MADNDWKMINKAKDDDGTTPSDEAIFDTPAIKEPDWHTPLFKAEMITNASPNILSRRLIFEPQTGLLPRPVQAAPPRPVQAAPPRLSFELVEDHFHSESVETTLSPFEFFETHFSPTDSLDARLCPDEYVLVPETEVEKNEKRKGGAKSA